MEDLESQQRIEPNTEPDTLRTYYRRIAARIILLIVVMVVIGVFVVVWIGSENHGKLFVPEILGINKTCILE